MSAWTASRPTPAPGPWSPRLHLLEAGRRRPLMSSLRPHELQAGGGPCGDVHESRLCLSNAVTCVKKSANLFNGNIVSLLLTTSLHNTTESWIEEQSTMDFLKLFLFSVRFMVIYVDFTAWNRLSIHVNRAKNICKVKIISQLRKKRNWEPSWQVKNQTKMVIFLLNLQINLGSENGLMRPWR